MWGGLFSWLKNPNVAPVAIFAIGLMSTLAAVTMSFTEGMVFLGVVAPLVFALFNALLIKGKYEAMKTNLATHGTSNPEKHGTEEQFIAQNTQDLPPSISDDLTWGIIARRAASMIKTIPYQWKYTFSWDVRRGPMAAEESDALLLNEPEGTVDQARVNMSFDNVKEAIQAIQQKANVTDMQKNTLLMFYQEQTQRGNHGGRTSGNRPNKNELFQFDGSLQPINDETFVKLRTPLRS